jgi:thiamine-phosphate pyrophosphorylase
MGRAWRPSGQGRGPRGTLNNAELAAYLRVIVIVERRLAAPRSVVEIVHAALQGGATAFQLRNKGDTARELLEVAHELRPLTRDMGALLFINDRLDVAMAAGADGVHLGPDDMPVEAARAAAPREFLIGRSTDDPAIARDAVLAGASYIGCGTVFATTTKTDAGDVIGLEGLRLVTQAVEVPVVGIGGITPGRAASVIAAGAAGVAVVGAIMQASDPAAVVRSMLGSLRA